MGLRAFGTHLRKGEGGGHSGRVGGIRGGMKCYAGGGDWPARNRNAHARTGQLLLFITRTHIPNPRHLACSPLALRTTCPLRCSQFPARAGRAFFLPCTAPAAPPSAHHFPIEMTLAIFCQSGALLMAALAAACAAAGTRWASVGVHRKATAAPRVSTSSCNREGRGKIGRAGAEWGGVGGRVDAQGRRAPGDIRGSAQEGDSGGARLDKLLQQGKVGVRWVEVEG
jgi:hypothetical protein